jgi:hypothetical protein
MRQGLLDVNLWPPQISIFQSWSFVDGINFLGSDKLNWWCSDGGMATTTTTDNGASVD